MEKNKTNKFILKQAKSLYNAKSTGENTLGNSANLILETEIKKVPYILRITEYSDKKKSHIDFELNWVNYLSNKLDSIVKPVKSLNNNLYEIIKTDYKSYILCMFEKAHGKIVDCDNPAEFNEKLFFDLGALMGNMHRLTQEYDGNIITPEFEWDRTSDYWNLWAKEDEITDDEVLPFEKRCIDKIRKLPKSKDCYGLTHGDIQHHNFFVDNGHIKLFDFDDCNFNWYAADIAGTLFYTVQAAGRRSKPEKECTEFAETYLREYLKGYMQTNTIDKYWVLTFDLFMRYRMTSGYKFVQNAWRNEPHPHQEYLDWTKKRITGGLPYVFIDYKKIMTSVGIK